MRGPHQPGGDGLLSLHLFAEHAQSMVFRYRLVPPRGFEYVSPSVTALTGYTPAEYYADPELAFKLVHPEDHHVLQAILEGKFVNPVALRFCSQEWRGHLDGTAPCHLCRSRQ
jgi:PAS fold